MNRKKYSYSQNSSEWFQARLGIPTASQFGLIVTPTGKPMKGEKRAGYMHKLLAERLTGNITQNFVTDAMRRGTELEPLARAWYSLETGRDVKQIGFATLAGDDWTCGGSPDGLCVDRGLEIKCPIPHTVIGQLLSDGPPEDYLLQIQGCMWIMDVKKWDLLIFSGIPEIPNRIFEIEADPEIHGALEVFIPAFCRELDSAENILIRLREG